ncbi:MAG: ABC transporter permease [Cyclobacteriaceae bacterium]|nr:ABC transporter permease [Cyclobacteriaceae bacterium]
MLKHYLTISFRNLWRNKFHSAINIFGLAIGVSACLVIFLLVRFELSYNKGFAGYESIYRIHSSFSGVFSGLNRGVPTATAPYIKENFKGVEAIAHFHTYSVPVKTSGPNQRDFGRQEKLALVSPEYFKVFDSYQWLSGNPEQSLSKPHQVVLTDEKAKHYFGELPADQYIDKELIYRDSLHLTVSGIVATLSFNTDLEITDFISYATIESSWLKKNFGRVDWNSVNSSSQLFIKAEANVSQSDIEAQLPLLAERYKEKRMWDVENNFKLQPLANLHYDATSGIFDFSRDPAHMPTLTTLSIVAILLLLIGCINFINLETAQAVRRAKEVGVRKVMGSDRARLIIQFIAESTLIALLSVLLALPFTEAGLLFFSEFIPQGITFSLVNILPFLIAILVVVGMLAGAYPAFVLSSFLPVLALKNTAYINSSQSRSAFLRKTLIVFQFTFAQVLIIGTLVVGWQIRYVLNKDLGFSKDAVVYFDTPWWEKSEKTALLKNEIRALSDVKDFSMSDAPPSANGWSSSTLEHKNETGASKINTFRKNGDPAYISFYNIKLVAGRNLAESDTVKELMINETLLKQLGFDSPEKAIGEVVTFNNAQLPVVGVVKDFHIQSMHNVIEPVVLGCENKSFTCFNIRLHTAGKNGSDMKTSLDKIEAAWKKIYPDAPFTYTFLDETLKNFYQAEQRIAKLINTATLFAIFISCLGLFGLASYSTTQRTKEIGIRKVLGASVRQITLLLTKDFLIFVLVAFVIAIPVAIWGANLWLSGYAYHVELNIWIFALTAIASLAIAFATISIKTIRAAQSNPVDSLRNE